MTSALNARLGRDYASDARLWPHSLDLVQRRVLVLDMAIDALAGASFLDDRVLQEARPQGLWMGESDFLTLAARAPAPDRLGFIFHVGHCGSTLIARLLAHKKDGFALKEPQTLRQLAEDALSADTPWDGTGPQRRAALLDALLRSWARRPSGVERVVVKATSLTSGLAPELMARAASAPALALRLKLEPYLATLLAPEPLSPDLTLGARIRFQRLAARIGDPGWRLHQLSPGELAAASWLAEAASLTDLRGREPQRVRDSDFEAFLAKPEEELLSIARHMELDWDEADASRATQSDIMRRYAKAPEHGYDPDFRARVLADSRARNDSEIRRGLAFAERMLKDNAGLEAAGGWL